MLPSSTHSIPEINFSLKVNDFDKSLIIHNLRASPTDNPFSQLFSNTIHP